MNDVNGIELKIGQLIFTNQFSFGGSVFEITKLGEEMVYAKRLWYANANRADEEESDFAFLPMFIEVITRPVIERHLKMFTEVARVMT